MSALDTQPFPKGPLIAAAALIGFTLVATAAAAEEEEQRREWEGKEQFFHGN